MRVEHIGNATLYLGDCLDILPTLAGVASVITDPPYGVGIKYGDQYDDSRPDYWDWLRRVVDAMRLTAKTVVFTHRVHALRQLVGWDWVGVWNKPGAFGSRIGNSAVLPQWEPIFLYGIHGAGTRSEYIGDVITWNPEPAKAGIKGIGRQKWADSEFASHPCPKPFGLMTRLVKAFGGDVVCDPFMGSGTTGVACNDLGKKFIGIEIEPHHFDASCRRIDAAQKQHRLFDGGVRLAGTEPPEQMQIE